MLVEILAGVVSLMAARVLWWRWKYDLHKMPSPEGQPIVGHGLWFARGEGEYELTQLRSRWYEELGHPKVMKLNLFGTPLVYVTDPECIKNVILSKTSPLPRSIGSNLATVLGNDPKAKALLIMDDLTPHVKALRRVYLTAFQSSSLRLAFPKLKGVLDRAIATIEAQRKKGPIDFQELCTSFTLDVIGIVALDANLGGIDGTGRIRTLLNKAMVLNRGIMVNPLAQLYTFLFPFCSLALEFKVTVDALTAEWDKLTKEILSRKDPAEGETPLWHELRKMKDPETGKRTTYRDLRAELGTVVLAGTDTTGHQLSCILAALGAYPDVVDTLLEELRQHGLYGDNARELTFEDLGELPYLAAVIKEGMRHTSIVPSLLPRIAQQDVSILGYRIPKGTPIHLPGNRWLDSVADWGDPRVFRPERWLSEEEGAAKNYYLGFSYGPRDCAGQRLALMELRVAIARFVTAYKFSPTMPLEELLKNSRNGMAVHAIDGIKLKVEPR